MKYRRKLDKIKSFDFPIEKSYTLYELLLNFPWNTGPDPLERVGLFWRRERCMNLSFSAIISSRLIDIGSLRSNRLLEINRIWSRSAEDIFPFMIEENVYLKFIFPDWVERGITIQPFPRRSSTYTGLSNIWFFPHTSFPIFSQMLAYHISFLFGFLLWVRFSIDSFKVNHFLKSFHIYRLLYLAKYRNKLAKSKELTTYI